MKKLLILIFLSFLLFLSHLSFAQVKSQGDVILGIWFNTEKDAKIEIYKISDRYFGKVIWLKNPNDEHGKPKTDNENPDPKLRTRPRLGLVILTDLVYLGSNKYGKAKIYDPKSGKTYSAQAELVGNDLLKLRGFILGMPLLGKTSEWTRAK